MTSNHVQLISAIKMTFRMTFRMTFSMTFGMTFRRDLEGDLEGDSKGEFRVDFKQDMEGDLLSNSGQVRSRSALIQVWFILQPKLFWTYRATDKF